MGKLNIWEEHVINEILSCTEFNITLVKDVDFFLCLSYNRNKYSAIANSIKNKDWETLKRNNDKCETNFKEDLTLVRFTNQDNEHCVATIFDSDEMWQDPKVIEVFI